MVCLTKEFRTVELSHLILGLARNSYLKLFDSQCTGGYSRSQGFVLQVMIRMPVIIIGYKLVGISPFNLRYSCGYTAVRGRSSIIEVCTHFQYCDWGPGTK